MRVTVRYGTLCGRICITRNLYNSNTCDISSLGGSILSTECRSSWVWDWLKLSFTYLCIWCITLNITLFLFVVVCCRYSSTSLHVLMHMLLLPRRKEGRHLTVFMFYWFISYFIKYLFEIFRPAVCVLFHFALYDKNINHDLIGIQRNCDFIFRSCFELLGYWHQRADERHGNPPQDNQKLLVVKDEVERPQVSLW